MSFFDKEVLKEALIYVSFFIITLALIILILVFVNNKKEESEEYVNFKKITGNVLVDETTNVLYYHYGGGITPIYNADGTLKLYKEN